MNPNTKKSIGAALALILLGMLVLTTGARSLALTIPAAVLVWYAAAPKLRSGRN
jgi:hypothetical protein